MEDFKNQSGNYENFDLVKYRSKKWHSFSYSK